MVDSFLNKLQIFFFFCVFCAWSVDLAETLFLAFSRDANSSFKAAIKCLAWWELLLHFSPTDGAAECVVREFLAVSPSLATMCAFFWFKMRKKLKRKIINNFYIDKYGSDGYQCGKLSMQKIIDVFTALMDDISVRKLFYSLSLENL